MLAMCLTYRYRCAKTRLTNISKGNIIFTYGYDASGGITSVNGTARFIYDECGEVRGFIYNGATAYLYLKNLQGDVTALVSDSGEIVMTYTYDAWGAVSYSVSTMQNMQLAVSLYNVNPY